MYFECFGILARSSAGFVFALPRMNKVILQDKCFFASGFTVTVQNALETCDKSCNIDQKIEHHHSLEFLLLKKQCLFVFVPQIGIECFKCLVQNSFCFISSTFLVMVFLVESRKNSSVLCLFLY